MTFKIQVLFLFICLPKVILGANILYIAPVASPSHHIWNRALAMGLLEKGHIVTMLGHDEKKRITSKNFTLILMEGIYEQEDVALDINLVAEQTAISGVIDMYNWASFCSEHDLNTKGFQRLMNYPEGYQFDMIIFDVTLGQFLYPVIEKFHDPPVVGVTPFLLPPVLSSSFGNHLYTSYMPFYHTEFTNKMNFAERLLNSLYTYFEVLYRNYIFFPSQTTLAKQHFGENIRPLEETERRISLLLSNVDPVLDYPIALPPNIIPVGGVHINPSRKLPQDLQEILGRASHGVVLFSLGSNIRSDQLKLSTRQALLGAFKKIPQTVFWKFEADEVEGLPGNVIIRKWLPQNDILGHKNTKLFISHGGALSTQEAIYHGIPVLGIPIFADQEMIIAKLKQKKVGLSLDIKKLTVENVYFSLAEILNNPTYTDNAKKLSKQYKDQPQTPLERAVFWVEYILRHGTAEQLNIPNRDMSFYKSNNLDVLVVLLLGVTLIYSFSWWAFTMCKFIFGTKRPALLDKKSN